MKITILLFASLREALQRDRLVVEVPEGSTPADAVKLLDLPLQEACLRVAVNHQFADWHCALRPDDEVSLIPPVAGG